MSDCQLYLITPPALDLLRFVGDFEQAISGGPVAALQLRLKDAGEDAVLRAVEALLPRCESEGIAFILNDAPELAKRAGVSAVHLGEHDMPYEKARKLLGKDAVIGVSCYDSIDRAMDLGEAGADYVAFGAFYPTRTKQAKSVAEPMLLAQWASQSLVPCVAIGGITPENAAPLVAHGADFLAVISGVWEHPQGPKAAVQAFDRVLRETENRAVSLALGG